MRGQRFVCLAGEDRLVRDVDPATVAVEDRKHRRKSCGMIVVLYILPFLILLPVAWVMFRAFFYFERSKQLVIDPASARLAKTH